MDRLANTTILIVDDNEDILELLRAAFEESGASVLEARDIEDALESFRCCPPHAVVSDIRLGASDGYELLKSIRELNREYRGFTPVIAVTGFASPEDEERAKAAGFNGYLAKPFDPEAVVRAIAKALSTPLEPAA